MNLSKNIMYKIVLENFEISIDFLYNQLKLINTYCEKIIIDLFLLFSQNINLLLILNVFCYLFVDSNVIICFFIVQILILIYLFINYIPCNNKYVKYIKNNEKYITIINFILIIGIILSSIYIAYSICVWFMRVLTRLIDLTSKTTTPSPGGTGGLPGGGPNGPNKVLSTAST